MLFREHFSGLTDFATRYTGDHDSAKEIVHGIFIHIWEKRDSFDWENPAKSYLFTSVHNRCLNFIRDRKKFIAHEFAPELQYIESGNEAFRESDYAYLAEKIEKALLKLPDKCREIFKLSRFENKKYAEIAEILNLSVKTVETQMSKALHIMKEELKDYLLLLWMILIFDNWF